MKKIIGLNIIFLFSLVIACTTRPPTSSPPLPPQPPPVPENLGSLPNGLMITDAAVEFDDTHSCPTSYSSQVLDMTFNKENQKTGYKVETTCKTTNEIHTRSFSGITYNQSGQRSGYQLQLSCSKTGGKYAVTVSQIKYDQNWGVLSYTTQIDGKTYYYKR